MKSSKGFVWKARLFVKRHTDWNPTLAKGIVLKEVDLRGDPWGFMSQKKWILEEIKEAPGYQVGPGLGVKKWYLNINFYTWE